MSTGYKIDEKDGIYFLTYVTLKKRLQKLHVKIV